MNSSVKLMKATGIIHIIHGIIMGIIMLVLLSLILPALTVLWSFVLFAISVGLAFLYIYIGYELFSLRKPDKMRNLLIASIIISGVEVLTAILKGQTAGYFFIIELIMSIIAISNIGEYKKYKS